MTRIVLNMCEMCKKKTMNSIIDVNIINEKSCIKDRFHDHDYVKCVAAKYSV